MFSIIRDLKAKCFGPSQADQFTGHKRNTVGVLDSSVHSVDVSHPTILFCRKYRLAVLIGVEFHANDVMLADQQRMAERRVIKALYGEILDLVDEAIHAVNGGDAEAAMGALLAIQRGCKAQ